LIDLFLYRLVDLNAIFLSPVLQCMIFSGWISFQHSQGIEGTWCVKDILVAVLNNGDNSDDDTIADDYDMHISVPSKLFCHAAACTCLSSVAVLGI